jgi:cystathionine gamma-lyase
MLKEVRLVWVETPANPGMEIADVRAVVAAAKLSGTLVAVDNTTATPLGQRPLELGADFSVCSDSKAMNGHSDVLLGHVACRDEELLSKVDQARTLGGAVAGPMEAWLLLRSLPTLPLRLERMSASALAVAEFLAARTEVSAVLYPGLPGHPGHAVAARQMRHFGPVLGFSLRDQAAAEAFLARAALVTDTTSFGGVTTTAERRARWGGDAVAAGFIRMSVGLEDAGDLIEDFGRALDGIR